MSWYSKKDVLKDLAQAMGGRFKDIDEQHIVVGEQPPPICTTTEGNCTAYFMPYLYLTSFSTT